MAVRCCCRRPLGLWVKAKLHCRKSGTGDDPEHWLDAVEQFSTDQSVGTDMVKFWAQLRVPDSQIRRRWDRAIYALVIYTLFYFSFSSAFAVSFNLDSSLGVDYCVDFVFMLDIGLSTRSFFYLYSGDLCTEPAQMKRNYLTNGMLFDVVGVLPPLIELILLLVESDSTYQRMFRLVRLLRLLRISKLPRFEKCHYTYLPGLRVAQVFVSFYAVVHVVACTMYVIFATRPNAFPAGGADKFPDILPSAPPPPQQEGSDDTSTWLNDDVVTSSTSERYIDALYISLLIVVGEDSYPTTSWQRAFVVGAMIVGACFYATVVGSVAVLVKNTDVQTSIYYEHMDALNSKMEVMELPKHLRRRVAAYYAFVWKRLRKFSTEHGEFQLNVESFIQELPLVLREEISLFLHKSMVQKVPIFRGCAESFLSDIVVHLRPQVNMPNELIIDVGGVGDRMFFLSSGAIEIFAASGRSLRMLKSGDYMGEFALITGEPRSAMAMARSFVLLHILLKADFERIMAAWPEYETRMAEACEKRLMSAAVSTISNSVSSEYVGTENSTNQEGFDSREQTKRTSSHEQQGLVPGKYLTRDELHEATHDEHAAGKNELQEKEVQDKEGPVCETQDPTPTTSPRRAEEVVVDSDMMKDVKAIRTILAKRNGASSTAGAHVAADSLCGSVSGPRSSSSSSSRSNTTGGGSTSADYVGKRVGAAGTRYHFTQPNEPKLEQWINDGDCRRSQGHRFARGHSMRFTELHAPATSRFSSARPSSFVSRPSSRGLRGHTTGKTADLRTGIPCPDDMSNRRGGRLLGELGGNGTMPLLCTTTDGMLAAKVDLVSRNYDNLAQGMAEIQATLAMMVAASATNAAPA